MQPESALPVSCSAEINSQKTTETKETTAMELTDLDNLLGSSFEELRASVKEDQTAIVMGWNFLLYVKEGCYVLSGSFQKGDIIRGYAVFSEGHEMLQKRGYVPMVDLEDPSKLLGMTKEEMTKSFGQYQDDVGSGD